MHSPVLCACGVGSYVLMIELFYRNIVFGGGGEWKG